MPKNEKVQTSTEKNDGPESTNHGPVKFILAYRIDREAGTKKIVRVLENEIKEDSNLIPWGHGSEESHPADKFKEARASKKNVPSARKSVTKNIIQKRFGDVVAKISKLNKEAIKPVYNAGIPQDYLDTFNEIAINDGLKRVGQYREELEEVVFCDAFPNSLGDAMYSGKQKKILNRGTFLGTDDLTAEDQAVADQSSASFGFTGMPRLSLCALYDQMRHPPLTIRHQVARRMLETGYFEDKEVRELYPICLLFSRQVIWPHHFDVAMRGDLRKRYPDLEFAEYKKKIPDLQKLIAPEIEDYFISHRDILKTLQKNGSDIFSFWDRFTAVWELLTPKQKNVLKRLYIKEDSETYEVAAKKLRISKDSLQDRVRGAIQKYKKEMPEFKDFKIPRKLGVEKKEKKIPPLYSYDLKTGRRYEISNQTRPQQKRLRDYEIAQTKAKIYEVCPIPFIVDTEYFDGTYPSTSPFTNINEKGNNKDDDD